MHRYKLTHTDLKPENILLTEEGYLKLPKGPGWGVELNEEAIREHPPIGIQNSAAGSS